MITLSHKDQVSADVRLILINTMQEVSSLQNSTKYKYKTKTNKLTYTEIGIYNLK